MPAWVPTAAQKGKAAMGGRKPPPLGITNEWESGLRPPTECYLYGLGRLRNAQRSHSRMTWRMVLATSARLSSPASELRMVSST